MNKNYTASDLCYYIFSDYEYLQDSDFKYIGAPFFQNVNKNARFDFIKKLVEHILEKSIPENIKNTIIYDIDPILFNQAVSKFSRDVYGQQRLAARLINMPNNAEKQEIEKFMDYGFKVNSSNPYIHRIAANFLYWFSVLKPFSVNVHKSPVSYDAKTRILCLCFNEFITYYLVQVALLSSDIVLMIDKKITYFEDFLTDLHFRNLSRSSLEFFLASYQSVLK